MQTFDVRDRERNANSNGIRNGFKSSKASQTIEKIDTFSPSIFQIKLKKTFIAGV